MRKSLGVSALVGVVLGATALTVQAQGKATELTAGLIGYSSVTGSCSGCTSNSISSFVTGGAYGAVAFYLSAGLAIEPSLAVRSQSIGHGGGTSTDWSIAVGLPIYFDKAWGRKGWYVEPGVNYLASSCTGCTSENQFGLGVMLGYKVPLNSDAALRIFGEYAYGFESSVNKVTTSTFGIGFGLSAFIK